MQHKNKCNDPSELLLLYIFSIELSEICNWVEESDTDGGKIAIFYVYWRRRWSVHFWELLSNSE